MLVWIYRRTHTGDPCDKCGIFGVNCCMRSKRLHCLKYDAVVGFGSPVSPKIKCRLTWVGIGPHALDVPERKYPLITFDHVHVMDKEGPVLPDCAPALWREMEKMIRGPRRSDRMPQSAQDQLHALVSQFLEYPPSSNPCHCHLLNSCGDNSHLPNLSTGHTSCA